MQKREKKIIVLSKTMPHNLFVYLLLLAILIVLTALYFIMPFAQSDAQFQADTGLYTKPLQTEKQASNHFTASNSKFKLESKQPYQALWPFEHWSKHSINVTNLANENLSLSFRVGVQETNIYDISPFPQPNALYLEPGQTESIIYFLDPSFRTNLTNNAPPGNYVFHVIADVWEQPVNNKQPAAPPEYIESIALAHSIKIIDKNQKANFIVKGAIKDEEGRPIIADINIEGNLNNEETISDKNGNFEIAVYTYKHADNSPNYFHITANSNNYKELHKIIEISNFSDATISLEMQKGTEQLANYRLSKTISTGLTIWRGALTEDEKYIAVAQGHIENEQDKEKINQKASVLLFDSKGNQLCKYAPGGEIWGLDISNNGKYIIASVLGIEKIMLLDSNCKPLYDNFEKAESREAVFSNSGDKIAIGTTEGQLKVYNLETKEIEWEAFLEGQIRKIVFTDDDNYIYAGSGDGNLYKLDKNGNILWRQFIGAWPYTYGIDLSDDESLIATMSKLGELSLLTSKGELLWTHDFSGGGEWASISHTNQDNLFVAGGAMHKTLSQEGEQLYWGKNSQSGMFSSGNKLLVGGEQSFLYEGNGKSIWTYNINKRVHFAYITNSEDKIILGDSDGNMYWFEKQSA
ncbi:PQQ-binding-like beta-propeller repeat protein [archaeon]|nr:PQQ-binding-like beta-propeller repeat protein [archaeon]